MRLRFALAACLAASPGFAKEFPTVDRVEYVLECMSRNGGGYEYVYKCSCVIDRIAAQLNYEQYVEAATIARHQSLAGERGGVFRDPDANKEIAKKYRSVQSEANRHCEVKR
jgi:hypothetical protein